MNIMLRDGVLRNDANVMEECVKFQTTIPIFRQTDQEKGNRQRVIDKCPNCLLRTTDLACSIM